MTDELESEFDDYFAEFNNQVEFDAEVCPKCGIDFTKDGKLERVEWVIVYLEKNEKSIEAIFNLLNRYNIKCIIQREDAQTGKTNNALLSISVLKLDYKKALKLIEDFSKHNPS